MLGDALEDAVQKARELCVPARCLRVGLDVGAFAGGRDRLG